MRGPMLIAPGTFAGQGGPLMAPGNFSGTGLLIRGTGMSRIGRTKDLLHLVRGSGSVKSVGKKRKRKTTSSGPAKKKKKTGIKPNMVKMPIGPILLQSHTARRTAKKPKRVRGAPRARDFLLLQSKQPWVSVVRQSREAALRSKLTNPTSRKAEFAILSGIYRK